MGMPEWWDERRLGLLIHASVASVPAWAPVGGRADDYRNHLGGNEPGVDGGGGGSGPLVEVLAHHRERWGHIERFDDFVPLLRFNDFDAETWARLAVEAGAGYAAVVARDRDGWVWWDAPTTTRTMVTNGPNRNVVADFAVACERNELPLGAYYAPPAGEASDDIAHDVDDLTRRFGVEFVRIVDPASGDHAGRLRDATESVRIVDVVPDDVDDDPWELHRDLGRGLGHNRTERAEHQLDGHAIVALATEVVAKGGHLLLSVGATADGAIPDQQAGALRLAGGWIRRHRDLIDRGRPWSSWGDEGARYLVVDGALHLVDIDGRGHFAALGTGVGRVESVVADATPVPFHQNGDGLHLDAHRVVPAARRRADSVDIEVYRVTMAGVERPTALFDDDGGAPRRPIELAPLLRDAAPGHIVQLGDGRYVGPAIVPTGVTIRGLGNTRTVVEPGTGLVVRSAARLEHLHVAAAADGSTAVRLVGSGALVLGCRVDGPMSMEADDTVVRATRLSSLVSDGIDRSTVSRCLVTSTSAAVGIDLVGGTGHRIESCEVTGHHCAIRCSETTESLISGNDLRARRCGVHLHRTEGAQVHGNFVNHTMRGIDIDGGAHALVHGNAVCDGDSGCIVEWGATGCSITGNTWERCRIGILTWESPDVVAHGNEAIDLHEPAAAFTAGP